MYRLVPITLEEYRILFDAGVWVYGSDYRRPSNSAHVLGELSHSRFPKWKELKWEYYYTRVEQDANPTE